MSSLRNAVKRITHKERSQPNARAHLGFLEKKVDYKKRALNYHAKEDRIQAMQRKATMRNPDEFYFGMHKSQIKDGKHQQTEEARRQELADEIGVEAVRIMKDQDLNYVRMQKQKDAKKAQRLQENLHLIGASSSSKKKSKHTIYVATQDDAEQFDAAEHFDTAPEFVDRAFNRPRKSKLRKLALQQMGLNEDGEPLDDRDENVNSNVQKTTQQDLKWQEKQAKKQARGAAKERGKAYGALEARTKRAAVMELAEAHLTVDKLVQGKGRKRKIKAAENGKPAQYKWRSKRKR